MFNSFKHTPSSLEFQYQLVTVNAAEYHSRAADAINCYISNNTKKGASNFSSELIKASTLKSCQSNVGPTRWLGLCGI